MINTESNLNQQSKILSYTDLNYIPLKFKVILQYFAQPFSPKPKEQINIEKTLDSLSIYLQLDK
jgi:hypothetical protein